MSSKFLNLCEPNYDTWTPLDKHLWKQLKRMSGVYIIKSQINSKFYVGESIDIKERVRGHLRSKNQMLHKAILKYGLDNFLIYIEYLPSFSKNELLDIEEQLILKYNCLVPNGYNICSRGQYREGYVVSDETKKKISDKAKGRTRTAEHQKKLNDANRGQKRTKEQKDKMSIAQKSKGPLSEQALINIREGLKNRPPECRKKAGDSNRGKKRTEESKKKISNALKGRKRSEEHKINLGNSHKGKKLAQWHKDKLREGTARRWEMEKLKKEKDINT